MEETSKKVRQREIKYLALYRRWLKKRRLPGAGLCQTIGESRTCLFVKDHIDYGTSWFWGYDGNFYSFESVTPRMQEKIRYDFTPLRQNIILFLAAMNGEL